MHYGNIAPDTHACVRDAYLPLQIGDAFTELAQAGRVHVDGIRLLAEPPACASARE